MNLVDKLEAQAMRSDLPSLRAGDTVRVHVKVKEGEKERLQVFEGVVIALKHGGPRATLTVRKNSFGHGVERIFPLHGKVIDRIEVVKSAEVRRAKLYYMRERRGKAARLREKRIVSTTDS
jgi:large subunit ribosomal protein L19